MYDRIELEGWDVRVADAQRAKALAPLACKTDRIDAWVLSDLARRDLVPEVWLPDPDVRAERERARFRLHLVRHRSALKKRSEAIWHMLTRNEAFQPTSCSASALRLLTAPDGLMRKAPPERAPTRPDHPRCNREMSLAHLDDSRATHLFVLKARPLFTGRRRCIPLMHMCPPGYSAG